MVKYSTGPEDGVPRILPMPPNDIRLLNMTLSFRLQTLRRCRQQWSSDLRSLAVLRPYSPRDHLDGRQIRPKLTHIQVERLQQPELTPSGKFPGIHRRLARLRAARSSSELFLFPTPFQWLVLFRDSAGIGEY